MKAQCNKCNRYIDLEYFDAHFSKCSSVTYIQDKMKKLYDKDIDKNDLLKLSERELIEKYYWILNRVYERTENQLEKRIIENILYGTNNELKNIM